MKSIIKLGVSIIIALIFLIIAHSISPSKDLDFIFGAIACGVYGLIETTIGDD